MLFRRAAARTRKAPKGGKGKKGKRGGEGEKKKTTAPRIPMWSPTMVLTGRHSG